jgi:hypothetical protein
VEISPACAGRARVASRPIDLHDDPLVDGVDVIDSEPRDTPAVRATSRSVARRYTTAGFYATG